MALHGKFRAQFERAAKRLSEPGVRFVVTRPLVTSKRSV